MRRRGDLAPEEIRALVERHLREVQPSTRARTVELLRSLVVDELIRALTDQAAT